MYEAEIAWHGGKKLKLISGTCNDGNYIISILKKRIKAERKQIRIERVLKAYTRTEKPKRRAIKNDNIRVSTKTVAAV